ncbi:MAG: protein-L-isoaspartate O-methyltransferase [Candidatus Hodarchaeota archaeon]
MASEEEKKKKLLDRLQKRDYIHTKEVRRAMEVVPREEFVPEDKKPYAYDDRPLSIGSGQTISAPHMCAMQCSALKLEVEEKITLLEVGTGSGYHATLCAEIMRNQNPENKVYTIERKPELADRARAVINALGYDDIITVLTADGTMGYPEMAPYDRILVTAAGPRIPKALKEQLGEGGIIVIPVGGRRGYQRLIRGKKIEGKIKEKNICGVAFVPLIGKDGFSE